MTPSPHADAARAAIADIEKAHAAAEKARAVRDTHIAAMHFEDGMRAPAIGRELGMSTSAVRDVIRIARLTERATG